MNPTLQQIIKWTKEHRVWMTAEQIGMAALGLPKNGAHKRVAGLLRKLTMMKYVEMKPVMNGQPLYRAKE